MSHVIDPDFDWVPIDVGGPTEVHVYRGARTGTLYIRVKQYALATLYALTPNNLEGWPGVLPVTALLLVSWYERGILDQARDGVLIESRRCKFTRLAKGQLCLTVREMVCTHEERET